MLLAHYEVHTRKPPVDYQLAICALESCLTATRMFIEFLGLWVKYKPLRLVESQGYEAFNGVSNEVKVTDLGGKFVQLTTLSNDEKDLLARFCDGVSKTTAHFTFGSGHGLKETEIHKVALLVDRLLIDHLYAVVERPATKHYK